MVLRPGPSPLRGRLIAPAGFTLLEVMIALALVSGLLVTMIYTVNTHLDAAGRHEAMITSTMLAREKLLELSQEPESLEGNFEEPYEDYTFVTESEPYQYPGVVKLTVRVSRGGRRLAELSELIIAK